MPLDSKSRGRDKRGDVFQKVEKAMSTSKDNGNKNKAVVQADINWRRCCLFSEKQEKRKIALGRLSTFVSNPCY